MSDLARRPLLKVHHSGTLFFGEGEPLEMNPNDYKVMSVEASFGGDDDDER